MIRPLIAAAVFCLLASVHAREVQIICDFEQDADLKPWQFENKPGALSDQHVTHGRRSLKLPLGGQLRSESLPQDWSAHDSFELDVFVEGQATVAVSLLIGDKAWQAKRTYWNRHNAMLSLLPGAQTISLPTSGLYRGEAAVHGRDLKTHIDPRQIVLFYMDFNSPEKEKVSGIYVDCVRLVREARPPQGVLAFDFGPETQALFPGFTPITWNSVYKHNGATAGLNHACAAKNRARDDLFPTTLYGDYVWLDADHEFVVAVPDGKHHVWLVFDDCGYWDGEQARFNRRTLSANGKLAWEDKRAHGAADYLFRFERVEPKPGDSLWELYVNELFKPARFVAEVTGGELRLQCSADGPLSTKVAALIVYPDSARASGEQFVAAVEQRNRKQFESRAICLGPKPATLDVPEKVKATGYWLGFPALEEDIALNGPPGPEGKLQRVGLRGQRLAFTFALRPLREIAGEVKLACSALGGPGGTIPASAIDLRYVHHLAKRRPSTLAYTIAADSLRRLDGAQLKLARDLTRQFWITVAVPEMAKAGFYSGELTLVADDLKLQLPLSVEVLDLAVDESEFLSGFLGAGVPNGLPEPRRKNAWRELLTVLKQLGVNTLSGGPMIRFSGLDAAGKPLLDFAVCDEYFRMLKEVGFTKAVYTYDGPALVEGLHDGHGIGETGRGWEKKTGKPFEELLRLVFNAVKAHAEQAGWPALNYCLLDEPKVLESAKHNLELHKAYREAVPFMYTGGLYSVQWEAKGALPQTIQELFKTMAWSGLNLHTQYDLDKAREFGRDIHIYNQGLSRYSFGAYQWAEMHKGVKGRIQWHTLCLAGYQFFDLDGQEPDSGVINWGRDEIIPTIEAARCAEGLTDFRLAVTLCNAADKHKDSAAAKAARDFLESISRSIPAGQRTPPPGLMSDESFRTQCLEHLRLLAK